MTQTSLPRRLGSVLASIACITLLGTGGCSSDASEENAAGESDLHAHDAENADGPPANDDPALGADTLDLEPDLGVDPADLDDTVVDDEIDDAADDEVDEADLGFDPAVSELRLSGNNCVNGGFYCGGDKVSGNRNTLYRCNGANKPITFVKKCARGCSVNPGTDDSCKRAPGKRAKSPVPGRGVTYAYGVRNSRYAAGYHTGQDYAAPSGSRVVAVRSGTIRWSNNNGGAYGRWIGLDAGNGRTYVYCHLSSRAVAAGTKVVAGQRIGRVGATGNVTGPHLHFEDHPRGRFVYAQVRRPSW